MKRFTVFLLLLSAVSMTVRAASPIEGAWELTENGVRHVAVFVDGYFSHSSYKLQEKKFISTRGGNYSEGTDGRIRVQWQYDTEKAGKETPLTAWLGQEVSFTAEIGETLRTDITGSKATWSRIDQNEGELAGVWRISGRKQDEEIRPMPLRDRRTLKILTGKRFQWVAINIATGEFSGTGGGTYTFENGKYTENIEFFSRDDSRVGVSLTFDGKMEEGNWHHAGLSSTGNPIYEIWGRLEN